MLTMQTTKTENWKGDGKNPHMDFRMEWLKQYLLMYFEESDGRIFNRMLKRHDNRALSIIKQFFEKPVKNIHDWKTMTLIFYNTCYKKNFYKWVYVTKKISKPIVSPPSPRPESPSTPTTKSKNKPVTKGKKIKEKKSNSKEDLKISEENIPDSDNQRNNESEKMKRKKSLENKSRPQSPQTVVEMGPQAESEIIIQKVKTLVKKKKTVKQFHCYMGHISKKQKEKNLAVLLICRKSIKKIPVFDTYLETISELPKYIFVSSLQLPEYTACLKKQIKIIINHIELSLAEPDPTNNGFTQGFEIRNLNKFKCLTLPYDTLFMPGSNYFSNFQTKSRKLYSECGKPQNSSINFLKTRLSKKEFISKQYTLKTIILSPLYLLNENLANIFYNIRQKKELKEVRQIDDQIHQIIDSPIKSNLINHLYGFIKKMIWCLNHVESDIDIEISPWPGIDELMIMSPEELIPKQEVLTKMEKKLEIWEKYIKTTLNKCRSMEPKGSGPVAEYQYWFKREDQLGPLILTLYGKHVSNILKVLKKVDSKQPQIFIEKRLSLRRYYEISRDNRDYISACIQCLEGINTAKYMNEVRTIIPEFWQNLRYLWLLSGYWAVKSNIVGFIERVQYLIVKKSIRVLEVNHFFMVPQVIAKHLALEVIQTMEMWKNSFQDVKAHIETHHWEMRWEFPLHRIFTITDYMAKLAKDFCYLSDSLKQYLDIFSTGFSKIVSDETIIDNFSEKVKSLTIPLRTADFNIYDPDNDVHWNLLIESFTRDLRGIEKASLQIINESFKNLRSSVCAADFLLAFEEVKSDEKSTVLLMKKFEFINIHLIKEIKLINEFIVNQIFEPPLLNYHAVHSGTIYWIRHLATSIQFRYTYLSSINEIKNTRTQKRAKNCFLHFIKFCELYQLTQFVDWVYIRKQNIREQLSGRIFKLKSIPTPFKNEHYKYLIMKSQAMKGLEYKKQIFNLSFKMLDNGGNGPYTNNQFKTECNTEEKKNKLNMMLHNKVTTTQKSTSSEETEKLSILGEDKEESESIKNTFDEMYKSILHERNLLMFLFHQEKQKLHHSKLNEVYTEFHYKNYYQSHKTRIIQDQFKGVALENSVSNEHNIVDHPKIKEALLPTLVSIDEIFILHTSSRYFMRKGYDAIVDNIIKVAENILNAYSEIPTHIMEAKYNASLADVYLFPSCFLDKKNSLQPFFYAESSQGVISDSGITYDHYASKEYFNFNRNVLFEILPDTSSQHKTVFEEFSNSNIENYLLLLNEQSESTIDFLLQSQYIGFSPLTNRTNERNTINNGQDMEETKQLIQCNSFQERNTTLRDQVGISQRDSLQHLKAEEVQSQINWNIPWHEYISDYLLIEKGHLVNLNFDVQLFDIILDIYHMTKLGYKLPSQFYGLCLLHRRILKDLRALKSITDKYNDTILKLTQETLLTLKEFFCEFEYLLFKGLKYYSWHTTKVDQFYIQLDWKMEQITNLKKYVNNISTYIDQNISKIKSLNWFNFTEITRREDMSVKDFFEDLEKLRDQTFVEFYYLISSIAFLLKKLEFLVLNKYSGENKYLVLYYKHYEEEIFKALVQNFLLNMKTFKNFIIGKGETKINLRSKSIPDVEYNFNADQCRYFFLRSIEKCLLRYRSIPRWKVGACELSSSIKSYGLVGLCHNYLEDMMQLKVIATELIDVRQLVDAVCHNISTYLMRWKKFSILWDFDKEITADYFFKSTDSIIDKTDTIFCYYDEFISELMSCEGHIDLYCIRLDLTIAVKEILMHALGWKNIFKCKLTELAQVHSRKLHQRLYVIHNFLTCRVKSLEDFQNILLGMKDFIELSSEYEVLVSFISKVQYILARHGLKFSEEDRKQQYEIQNMFSVIQKLSKYRLIIIKPSFNMYKKLSEERILAFAEECNFFAQHYYTAGPGSVGAKLDQGYMLLQEFKKSFNDLNLKRKSMVQAENLFCHTPQSYKTFDEAFEEFQLLEVAYSLYEKQKDAQIQWAKIPWIYLNSTELTSGIDELLLEFENLSASVKTLTVSQEIWLCMKNFKDSIPLMVELKNESLKERHWEELMLKTGHHFEMLASKFTLKDMIYMKLYMHKSLVNDIIGKADKELMIETNINFVKKFWNSQKLKFTFHDKEIILDDTYNTLLLLDDYCINLQRMAGSQFSLPFLEEIKIWEKQLANIRETVNELTILQTNVMNFAYIFSNKVLQKLLAKAYKQYEIVDKDFTKLMNVIRFKRNIIEQTLVPGLSESILGAHNHIENCKKLLSNYLNSVRNQFPRFFLLQDEEVIFIIGSKNPQILQDFIPKIYFNLKDVILNKNNSENDDEINGMVSSENEVLMYRNPIQLVDSVSSWMSIAQEEMKCSKKYMMKMAIYSFATVVQSRIEWIYTHISSCILGSIKVWWTLEIEDTLKKVEKGEMQAMKNLMNKLTKQLNDIFLEVSRPLKSMDRMKFRNVVLADLYGIDVVRKLSNCSIISVNDFEWESQIRFYWKKHEDSLIISQCLEQFDYGCEYMGIGGQLVITPLTERIYIGLTQALSMCYGGALTGPANTGKTETVKELAKMLGIFCIFLNCSNVMAGNTFKKLFYALCQDGIWGCFDEFNLISEPALTEIWKAMETIRTAMINNVNRFMLHEKEIKLNTKMRIFITMNPGFSGNETLSQPIRLLFRPIACISPHTEQICQAMLFSEGFVNAKVLAKKMARLYELAQTQLSKQGCYDFGLRSIKSLLSVIGDFKRKAPDMEEIVVLMRAIRDSNRSKMLKEDELIFIDLVHDIFPGVDCPPILYPELEKAVCKLWTEMNYTFNSKQASKVVEVHETLELKQSAIVVGPTGGGKSVVINTFCQAQSQLGITTSAIKINPKAMPLSHLFGYFHRSTQQWLDGLFWKLFKEINNKGRSASMVFIIFDGDIDPLWTENINSVMDDNRQLTLANCERILIEKNCKLLFETGHIENVSPGFISRSGVVFVDPKDNNYRSFWKRWLPTRIDESEIKLLNIYFEKYVPFALELIFGELNELQPLYTVIQMTKLHLVVQLCFMIDALLPIVEKEVQNNFQTAQFSNKKKDSDVERNEVEDPLGNKKTPIYTNETISMDIKVNSNEQNAPIECMFIQALYISLGAVLSEKSLIIFDTFIKKLSKFDHFDDSKDKKASFGFLPTKFDTIFDYCADLSKGCWIPWSELVKPYIHERYKQFDEIIVPTKDSCKLVWLMKIINEMNCADPYYKSYKYKMKARKKRSRPMLLLGESVSSKSITLKEFTQNLDPEKFVHGILGLSFQTSAENIQDYLESFLMQYTPYTKRPKDGKKLIIFLDDLNRPQVDPYGSQESTAFLKMLIENGGLFSKSHNLNWMTINDVYYYATLSTNKCSKQNIDPRFLSLFLLFSTCLPNDHIISQIYSSILEGHMVSFDESIKCIRPKIIAATIDIYKFASQMLRPTPMKFHYTFNLRDFSHIIEGLLQTSPPYYKSRQQFLRVWRNEVTRIMCDRLITQVDELLVKEKIKNIISEYFPESIDYVMRDPLLFGDYRNAMQPGSSRDYEDLLDYEAVYHLFTEILDEIRKITPHFNLVLFEHALDHLTRIHRILRIYRGHALVVGPIGSGKQTLVNLASYTAGSNNFTIKLSKGYDENGFRLDMKDLYLEAGLQNKKTTFILKAHQIISESFLEIVNTILVTGRFDNIFTEEERTLHSEQYFSNIDTDSDSIAHKYSSQKKAESNCLHNLHIVLLMTHFDEELRKTYYKFPGLINNTIIDWIHSWPSEALYAVGRRHLKEVQEIPVIQKEAIVEVVVFIHENIIKYLNELNERERFSYITPRHFLDLIQLYITLFYKNVSNNFDKCQNLENAITKVKEARRDIEEMKKVMVQKKISVDDKKYICTLLWDKILNASDILDTKTKASVKKCQEIDEMNKELNEQLEEIQASIARAKNDIDKAQESVRDLDLDEINKISEQDNPTDMVAAVFECILILLGFPVINWQETRKMLNDPLFLSNLEEINLNSISILQQKQIRSRLKKIKKVQEIHELKSAEAAYLLLVEAILNYCSALRETKPKQERISELERELIKGQNALNSLNIDIREAEKDLEGLNEKYSKAVSDNENEEAELHITLDKSEAALKLLSGLQQDNATWEQELSIHQKCKPKIVGNSLMSATFLIYAGLFTWEQRKVLFLRWLEKIRIKRIPISKPFKLEAEFTDNILLNKWKSNLLPNCEWSLQNAVLIAYSFRHPFCIDPNKKALKWVLKQEKENNLTVLTFEDSDFYEKISMSIKAKFPILIKDIEFLDPIIFYVLEKLNEEVSIDPNYGMHKVNGIESGIIHLYMTTKFKDLKFDPLVFSQTTVINFEMAPEEVEDTLVNIITKNEQRDVWNHRKGILKEIYLNVSKEYDSNQTLLRKVGAPEQHMLQSTEHIKELYQLKLEIDQVQLELKENHLQLENFEILKNKYIPIARCGTVLYLVMNKLKGINILYQHSLRLHIQSFKHILEKYRSHPITERHIEDFNYNLKKYVCQYGCQGVFPHHKMLVPLLMAIELEKSNGLIAQKEIDFFLTGSGETLDNDLPPIYWLSKKGWNDLKKLALDFQQDFGKLPETLTLHTDDWEKWHHSRKSVISHLPSFVGNLKPFQKLMLLRCLCPEDIPHAITTYISESLGEEFINTPSHSLNKVFEDYGHLTPIILITKPGINALQKVMKLGEKYDISNVHPVELSSAKLEAELIFLQKAMTSGEWVIYRNWHTNNGFCQRMEHILQSELDIHSNFRLWLFIEQPQKHGNCSIPPNILQISIRVVIDTPDPLKLKLHTLYEEMESHTLESSIHPSFKPLVYVVSFFHSVIQERKKYGKIGWNREYDFGHNDFFISIEILRKHLSNAINNKYNFIPWKYLKFLIGEIVYGGYILDNCDRRLISTYLEEYFDDSLFGANESFKFYCGDNYSYGILPDGNKDDYIAEIDKIPLQDTACVIGLNSINDIIYNNKLTLSIWKNISELQGNTVNKLQLNKEDEVINITQRIMGVIPDLFNIANIKISHKGKKFIGPTYSILLHELEGFNCLISMMNSTIKDLTRAIRGEIKMEEEISSMLMELYNGLLPCKWGKLSHPFENLGIWINHFVQRVQQYKKWVIEGELPAIWLGGLHAPRSYLMSILQLSSKNKGWPLENLVIKTEMTQITVNESVQEPPELGCYISGLFLQGASWDSNKKCVIPLASECFVTNLPILWIVPAESFSSMQKENLRIPVYETILRNHGAEGLVFEAELDMSIHKNKCVLEGVCILLNKV